MSFSAFAHHYASKLQSGKPCKSELGRKHATFTTKAVTWSGLGAADWLLPYTRRFRKVRPTSASADMGAMGRYALDFRFVWFADVVEVKMARRGHFSFRTTILARYHSAVPSHLPYPESPQSCGHAAGI